MKTFSISLFLMLFMMLGTSAKIISPGKPPVVIEVLTNHKTVAEALVAAKNALMSEKFIVQGGIQETSFNATRTTASKADYYVADVVAAEVDGKIKITITFIKIGSGLLKLEKVAETIKASLQS